MRNILRAVSGPNYQVISLPIFLLLLFYLGILIFVLLVLTYRFNLPVSCYGVSYQVVILTEGEDCSLITPSVQSFDFYVNLAVGSHLVMTTLFIGDLILSIVSGSEISIFKLLLSQQLANCRLVITRKYIIDPRSAFKAGDTHTPISQLWISLHLTY